MRRLALVAFLPLLVRLPRGVRRRGRPEGGARERRRARRRRADHARRVRLHARATGRARRRARHPAAGTTAFLTARNKLLDQLVQEAEFEQQARSQFGIVIGDAQVDRQLEQLRDTHVRRLRGPVQRGARAAGSHGGAGPGADPAAAARRGRLRPAERRGLGLRRRGRALLQKPPQGLRAAGQAPGSAHPRPHTRAGRRAGAQAADRRRLRRAREALLDRRRDGVVRRRPGRGHHAGPDAPRVRPGRLLAEDERDLGARPHAERLAHHPGDGRRHARDDDAAVRGAVDDRGGAPVDEAAERARPVGRRDAGGVREARRLRPGIRARARAAEAI